MGYTPSPAYLFFIRMNTREPQPRVVPAPILSIPGRTPGTQPENPEIDVVSHDIHTLLIQKLSQIPNDLTGKILTALESLNRTFTDLKCGDRNMFVGILNEARKGRILTWRKPIILHDELLRVTKEYGASAEIKLAVSALFNLMKKLGIDTENPDHADSEKDFADDLFLYIRATDPLGTNILNPQEEIGRKNAMDLGRESQIIFSGVTIHLSPIQNGKVKARMEEHSIPTRGYRGSVVDFEIPEDRQFYIGRPLVISKLFGYTIDPPVAVAMNVTCTHPQMSRGACMVIRKGNELYVYDRGSKNKVKICSREMGIDYEPESHILENGSLGYGDSQILDPDELEAMRSSLLQPEPSPHRS